MAKTVEEMMDSLGFTEERRARIKREGQKELEEYESLQAVRKELGVTQLDVAEALNIKQNNISDLEARSDMKLSTLRNYLQALGGELVISAKFSDQDVRVIESLSH